MLTGGNRQSHAYLSREINGPAYITHQALCEQIYDISHKFKLIILPSLYINKKESDGHNLNDDRNIRPVIAVNTHRTSFAASATTSSVNKLTVPN
jgi:hypothetical protein